MENMHFLELRGDIVMSAFDIEPPEGLQLEENFPNCCDPHSKQFQSLLDWYDKFPNCCEYHEKMSKKPWFEKENYSNVPLKVMKQLAYTVTFIVKTVDSPNWLNNVKAYIQYNWWSFGQPPIGYDKYLKKLKLIIEADKDPEWEERNKLLLSHINELLNPSKADTPDLNLLTETYLKWLKTFPFDVPFFNNLKDHFYKQLPILDKPPTPNPFTGLAWASIIDEKELIKRLIETTNKLLNEIDSTRIAKEKLIENAEEIEWQVMCQEHRIKQQNLLQNFSKDEKNYIRLVKKWLVNERKFFKKVKEKIKAAKPNSITQRKKRQLTPLTFFKNSKESLEHFIQILESLDAIDDSQCWIYGNSKKSAVLCFKALIDQRTNNGGTLVEIINGSELQSMIKKLVNIEISIRSVNNILKNFDSSDETYQYFFGHFEKLR
jgi:hypothetical protein